ncbi:MAG TPA: hypothetical protein VIW80_03980 [Pyrinomonadaceae bacterium]|jgi:hypothetical protein
MEILIPKHLGYRELNELTVRYYEESTLDRTSICIFDWRAAERVSLPQVVAILNWSSKLTQLKKRVEWIFARPSEPIKGIEEMQFWSDVALGEELYKNIYNQLNELRRQARHGRLYPSRLRAGLNRIRATIDAQERKKSPAVERWISAEEIQLSYMNLLAYLNRYMVFDRAEEVGIVMLPDPRSLPKTVMARAINTGSLELRPIHSPAEIGGVVEQLCDPQELTRVLGAYADLDVARRGALAQILVTELGQNVGEHAKASAAWLCTRIVSPDQTQIMDEPMLRPFREHREGFLEIIVCDNGRGLTTDLAQILDRDQRESVRSKYEKNARGYYEANHLIDYAFDRLSSTKRDIAQLIHLEKQPQNRQVVASGLYWVWNVVRSHQGVLAVSTADTQAWYDFTVPIGQNIYQSWVRRHLDTDMSAGPTCGTTIRICLPLKERLQASAQGLSRTREEADLQTETSYSSLPYSIKIVWVGDLALKVPVSNAHPKHAKASASSQNVLPGIGNAHELRLLKELQENHLPLNDGDILVLDLCGMRKKWATPSVAPLCHFFLEMNYTSTVGRSAVVLWNVPSLAKELFEDGIEIAGEPYSHLEDFRRAALMVYDDGTTRLFCGWDKAEKLLNRLRYEGELDLDDVRDIDLNEAEQTRLRLFITENSHLFNWVGRNRLRLRPWSFNLLVQAWEQGMEWFDKLLNKDLSKGGVLLSPKRGFFRLPSNGLYVKSFYQFRGLLSNHQDCARIAWHIAQIVKAIASRREKKAEQTIWLISVSRSPVPLLQHLADNYFQDGNTQQIKVLAESKVEELEVTGRSIAPGDQAILITDVISSGTLCEQIARAVPNIEWLGTIALLDAGQNASSEPAKLQSNLLGPDLRLMKTRETITGPVYALACRQVKKYEPAEVSITEPVTAIDEVNVCAVINPEKADADSDFWSYLERKPSALRVGHLPGDYHHYVYYVHTGELLNAIHPADGQSLLNFIVKQVVADLAEVGSDPDEIVIMHPPRNTSYAERIGKAVQEITGALYRHTLYKDNFAGHWRFSPFVQHGVPLENCTLVLIDDGTNTAETLMGLLDAATLGNPSNILAYVGVTRMPPHKNHLFLTLKGMKNVNGKVNVRFTLSLNVPVYSSRDCPICRLRRDLARVEDHSLLLRKYAQQLKSELAPTENLDSDETPTSNFLWQYASPVSVTKLREAFETLDYNVSSSEHVNSVLLTATAQPPNEGAHKALLDLGFILCSEPEIAGATVLVPYLTKLLTASSIRLRNCPEEELMTVIGLTFHLLLQLVKRKPVANLSDVIKQVWQAMFDRNSIKVHELCRIITYILAEALTGHDIEHEPYRAIVCQTWLHELRGKIKEETAKDGGSIISLVYLYIREALAVLYGERPAYVSIHSDKARTELFDLADRTAGIFWWHASDNVKGYINPLLEALSLDGPSARDVIYGPIHELVRAFDELYELQQRLCEIEQTSQPTWHEKPGAGVYWNTPELSNAMAACVVAFTDIAEQIEARSKGQRIDDAPAIADSLSKAWEDLYRSLGYAYDAIFPPVFNTVSDKWDKFQTITGLPHSVDGGIPSKSEPPRQARVFIPRMLLHRFMTVAMQNLGTAAFSDWTKEQIDSHARAFVEVASSVGTNGRPIICVRVVDNGILNKSEEKPSEGHNRGLRDIALMAENFSAKLSMPTKRGEHTVVEVCMMHRTAKESSSHVKSE